jgi:hypothetical protein
VVIVAFAGSGSGSASISDNLGTTYNLVNSVTNPSDQHSTVYVWVGVLIASGALTITTSGTFPIQAVDAAGSNAGGQLYFVEAAGVDTTTPLTLVSSWVNQVPSMTSATAPSGVASASESYYTLPAWYAFSQEQGGWVSNGSALPQYLQYQFDSAKTITSYQITPWSVDNFPSYSPTAWVLKGSNDGSSWTDLDTRSFSAWVISSPQAFDVTSPGSYAYYRLHITANGGNAYTGVHALTLNISAGTGSFSLANNGPTSTRAVDSAFTSVAAGSMLLMAAAQGYNWIGQWLSHTGTSLLQQSDQCSAVGVVPVPSTGDYSIGFSIDGGGSCPMSSVALVLNPAATAPSFNTITAVQSAMDTAGSNPWTTGLSVTAGNALVVCQSGTHLGTAAITDNRGTTYVKVGTYSGDYNSAIVMWCGIPATSGALTITQTGTFALVAAGVGNAGGMLSVIEFSGVNANGPMMAVSDTWGTTTPTGALASRNAWAQEGAMLVQGAAQGWMNVGGWTAVSPATLAQNADSISALSYSPVVSDGDTIAVGHAGGGPAVAINLALSPTMVATGATTSLFRSSTLSGLGSGGPFFYNPLN